jgi:hypothetical protein
METGDKLTVSFSVWAEYTVKVELTDEIIGEDGEVDFDVVMDEAYNNLPGGLCHQCSTGNSGAGWGQESPVYLELGEDPEVKYILGPDGKAVYGDPDKPTSW